MADTTTRYSPEERAKIIAHILAEVSGGRNVARILREDEGMPSKAVFWQWHFSDEQLQDQLARARENGIEALMDDAIDIAHTPMEGEIVTTESGGEGGPVTKTRREDMLGHRKLMIDTIIKAAQMMKPKKYGPKLDLTSGGEKIGMAEAIERGRQRALNNADHYKGE